MAFTRRLPHLAGDESEWMDFLVLFSGKQWNMTNR